MKRTLITGIFGQDGYYLSKLLIEKSFEVIGFCPENLIPDAIQDHMQDIPVFRGSVTNQEQISEAIKEISPDEIYNFAAPSFVPASWDDPAETENVAGLGLVRILKAVKKINPAIKVYQASSSELFGDPDMSPQNEETPFKPSNPYAASKLYAHNIAGIYRRKYGLFICCGILFNHESPMRPEMYITRKVTSGVARIKLGLANELRIGNPEARRDWGFAGDYVEAMWSMLQQSQPDDYVIGTGITHSVQDLIEICFKYAGLDWRDFVVVDPGFYRSTEKALLVADNSKAGEKLGWKPRMSFKELLHMMIDYDLKMLSIQNDEIRKKVI